MTFLLFLGIGCTPAAPSDAPAPTTVTISPATDSPFATPTLTVSPTTSASVTPQPRLTLSVLGPEREQFPAAVNPLTGRRIADPAMLDLPAVLVSISNLPATARPQAGTSFASLIFELFIGTGTTRFMGVFYGDLPRRIPNVSGSCDVRTEISQPGPTWIGNRIWLDENADGIQDPWEAGIGGVCVELFDAATNQRVASTSSDANGYYFFDTEKGRQYVIAFEKPSAYDFTTPNIGNDDEDSDADPLTGRTAPFDGKNGPRVDAGLTLTHPSPPTYSPADIAPERTYVGPIRSGRLTYNDFHFMFPASCLVYASAAEDIGQRLRGCEIIYGEHPNVSPNTALLDTTRLKALAERSKIAKQPVNYSGNLFDPTPPTAGRPADSLWMYFHSFAQSFWQYDPVAGLYLRQTDDADGLGRFHTDTDRLTGRQLGFENVIVITADYKIFRHLQYDVELCCAMQGWAYLFRDGQMYKIRWATTNRAWEKQTGFQRPIHFIGDDKQPFPLKPGRTWISIMTLNSVVKEQNQGAWQALFAVPNDREPDE